MTFGTASHVNPYLAALSELVDEGNQVTYFAPSVTLGYSSKYPKISTVEMNLDQEQVREIALSSQKDWNATKTDITPLFKGIVDLFRDSYLEIERFDQKYHPDLFICDIFNTACVEYANAEKKNLIFLLTNIGSLGVGESWYTPSLMYPIAQQELVRSFRARLAAKLSGLPSLNQVLTLRSYMAKLKQDKKEFGLDLTSAQDTVKKHLILTHNVIGFYKARELPTNVIPIGPMISDNVGQLDGELQSQLDRFNKDGISVVYIAFGSAANVTGFIGDRIFEGIKLLLHENPNLAAVWALGKSDASSLAVPEEFRDRLLFKQWVNQRALLAHPATKVFCTHGGIASIHESMYAGVPIVVTGIFGDQFLNAIAAQEAKIGLENKKMEFTPSSLKEKIVFLNKEIADPDSEIFESVQKMKKIVRLNSVTHKLYLKNLFEMAATVGYAHLVPITSKLTWWQIYGEFYSLIISLLIGFIVVRFFFKSK
ncbi:hypothetical protein HDV01_003445 [Terramyces sp. JEL0728]|nr:hypothetical protein HDV01_003445 [Terramyces sp. JEL0728]